MGKKTIIASTAVAATIAVAAWFLQSADGNGADATDRADRRAASVAPGAFDRTAVGVDIVKQRAAEQEAARRLVVDFDRFIARIMTGDPTLDGAQRMDMAYMLERAVEYSPAMREALRKRLEKAFRNNEITALMELERAFNSSSVGSMELIDVYSAEVARGGALDYYALQNASYFMGAIPEETRNGLVERSFAQLSRYDEHAKYNGAMLFLSTAIRSGANIPEHYRDTAIDLIQGKLESAAEGDEQYFAAQNLYKLFSAGDAARRAESILKQRPTFSIARATLEAIVHGRMTVDAALIQTLTRVAAQRGLSQDQSLTLQELLARVPSASQNGSGG